MRNCARVRSAVFANTKCSSSVTFLLSSLITCTPTLFSTLSLRACECLFDDDDGDDDDCGDNASVVEELFKLLVGEEDGARRWVSWIAFLSAAA